MKSQETEEFELLDSRESLEPRDLEDRRESEGR